MLTPEKKKKIVRVTTVPASLKVLLKGQLRFVQKELEVIAVSSPGKELKDVEEGEGVKVYPVSMSRKITPLKDIKSIFKLYRFLRKEKPFIVHTHTPKAGFAGMTASWMAGVPNRLHTIAGLPLTETRGLKRLVLLAVEKYVYRLSTLILPNSYGSRDFIIRNKLTSENKLKMIGKGSSNGIDLKYFSSSDYTREESARWKDKLGLTGKFIFLFIGRIVSHKGINELITCFLQVNAKFPDTVLVLVGEFEDNLDPLSNETKQKLSDSSIRLAGHQPDVRPFLELADVFVFPSYREGFPNVLLQACSFNLPCIASDIGGCNEIVENNVNGISIPPKDEKALSGSMEMLYSNPDLRRNLSIGNRTKIERNFGQEFVWGEIMKLYKSL